MKFLPEMERSLLELLESEDQGEGIAFSNKKEMAKRTWREDIQESINSNHDLTPDIQYHLYKMYDAGSVLCKFERDWEVVFEITAFGHQRLEYIRNNSGINKVIRVVGGWLDNAMSSIFMPIVVSVVTVFVLRYFELDSK